MTNNEQKIKQVFIEMTEYADNIISVASERNKSGELKKQIGKGYEKYYRGYLSGAIHMYGLIYAAYDELKPIEYKGTAAKRLFAKWREEITKTKVEKNLLEGYF